MPARNPDRRVLLIAPAISRFALVAVLLMTWAIAASAYTLVFRDGRRIEVPSGFALTGTTLTYEVGPGFSKTVQLILIDVAATERANNETAGAFFQHAEQKLKAAAPSSASPTRVTLTNRELDSTKKRRIESEQEYERRRVELGLPSIEESRRRQAQEEETLLAQVRLRAVEQTSDEAYWRTRARMLRSEIGATDAEISYLRARLGEVRQFPLATHSLITSVLPFVSLGSTSAIVSPPIANSGQLVAPRGFSSRATGRGQVMTYPSPAPFRGRRFAQRVGGFPFGLSVGSASFGFPVRPFDYLEDAGSRANLSDRLDSLLIMRVGLEARWRELEDQARDAKAPQIWLEP